MAQERAYKTRLSQLVGSWRATAGHSTRGQAPRAGRARGIIIKKEQHNQASQTRFEHASGP